VHDADAIIWSDVSAKRTNETRIRLQPLTFLAFSVVSHRDIRFGLTRCGLERTFVAVSFSIATTDWSIVECAHLVADALWQT